MTPLGPLYAITDPTLLPGNKLLTEVNAALDAGITAFQYRDKLASNEKRAANARALVELINRYNALLIINDDPYLAQSVEAHGVHLGQTDNSVAQARSLLGEQAIIGVTCHDQPELALKAESEGADYVAFGRFFSSTTKPDARVANLEILTWASKHIECPAVAIGGIKLSNMPALLNKGARTVAICHSLFGASDTYTAARALINQWNRCNV